MTKVNSCVIHISDAQAALPGPAGEHALNFLRRGSLRVMLSLGRSSSLPRPTTPHEQDEVYVVVQGRGVFFHDGKRDAFEAGDLLFVAAGVEHRFEDFSEDLAVWVIFYGREGGEISSSS